MAQLRDAQTSELLATGTPEDIALVAKALSASVLYDDVGETFNTELILEARSERMEHAEDASDDEARGVELEAMVEKVAAVLASAQDGEQTLPPVDLDG